MNILTQGEIDRRRFLATCAAGACAVATSGCASLATHPVPVSGGVARVSLTDHPVLRQPTGAVKVLPAGERDPLIVLALDNHRFTALSPVCTHRGCVVDVQGDRLVCPCHGSTYDRDGTVLRGPAERPLRRYAVRTAADYVEIDLRSQS